MKYRRIPLAKATLVSRRQERDIQPPGLVELKNGYIQASDPNVTIRPGCSSIYESLTTTDAGAASFSSNATIEAEEFLNSISSIYGSNDLVYFTNRFAYYFDKTTSPSTQALKSEELAFTTAGGDDQATFTQYSATVSRGTGGTEYNLQKMLWPGCYIRPDGTTKWYRVKEVTDGATLTLETVFAESTTTADYDVLRPHPAENGTQKLNAQHYTTGIVYSAPQPARVIDPERIAGPWHSFVGLVNTGSAFESVPALTAGLNAGLVNILDATEGATPLYGLVLGGTGDPTLQFSTGGSWSSVDPADWTQANTVAYLDGAVDEDTMHVAGLKTVTFANRPVISTTSDFSSFSDVLMHTSSELVTNGSFAADISGWTASAGDGTVAWDGVGAIEITAGASTNSYAYQQISVSGNTVYSVKYDMSTNTDNTNSDVRIYDVTNAGYISQWSEEHATAGAQAGNTKHFYAPSNCSAVRVELWCPDTNTEVVRYDNVSLYLNGPPVAALAVSLDEESVSNYFALCQNQVGPADEDFVSAVYKSANKSQGSWSIVKSGVGAASGFTDMAYLGDQASAGYLVIGGKGGIFVSTDEGANWTEVTHTGSGSANTKDLVIEPSTFSGANRFYIGQRNSSDWTASTTIYQFVVGGSTYTSEFTVPGSVAAITTVASGGSETVYVSLYSGSIYRFTSSSGGILSTDVSYVTAIGNQVFGAAYVEKDGVDRIMHAGASASGIIDVSGNSTTKFDIDEFTPVSEAGTFDTPESYDKAGEYRSLTHACLDGYVILIGCSEYWDGVTDTDVETADGNAGYVYFPRRIRWSVPGTYNNFSDAGSGFADLTGHGALLDARPVNGRVVIFESSQISVLTPGTSSAWDYEVIKENIRAVSNPVVVDDTCYFVASDGLLYGTNGASVQEAGSSFDLTQYTDYNLQSPVLMDFCGDVGSLIIFQANASSLYLINLDNGGVSKFSVSESSSSTPDTTAQAALAVNGAEDRRLILSYQPLSDGTITATTHSFGSVVTGLDDPSSKHHATVLETGYIQLAPEGEKIKLINVGVETYSDGTTNPHVAVQVRSLEDTEWHDAGDFNATITAGTASCSLTGSAASNLIGTYSGAGAFTTPCLATQARVYLDSTLLTLGTDYTVTGTNQITLVAGLSGSSVYVYWENEPQIRIEAGDLIESDEGYHRVTAATDYNSLTLDWYPSSEDTDADHIPAEQMGNGRDVVTLGVNKLVDAVKIRVIVAARSDCDATIPKVTAIILGYVDSGERKSNEL